MIESTFSAPTTCSHELQYCETSTHPTKYPFYPSYPSTLIDVGTSYLGLWLLLLTLFLAHNLKCIPGIWHMRILNAFRFILRTQRPAVVLKPSHIFQPLITTSEAQLLEIDFNLHKNNSTYFSDIDISRSHLACTLFSNGIEKMRGGTSAYVGTKNRVFGLALGSVSCSFKKEIAPYEQYEMWSRILSWDEKWIYIVTHFVREGTAQPSSYSLYPQTYHLGDSTPQSPSTAATAASNGEVPNKTFKPDKDLYATALSKCVFKSGRETVSPETMLYLSDLLSPTIGQSERENIETQRSEGYKVASTLAVENQKAIEAEFGFGDGEALGKHTDGTGVAGVISTLLQLAGLKGSQAL